MKNEFDSNEKVSFVKSLDLCARYIQVQIGYMVGGYSNRPDIVIITTKFKSKSIYFDTKHIGYSDTRL